MSGGCVVREGSFTDGVSVLNPLGFWDSRKAQHFLP